MMEVSTATLKDSLLEAADIDDYLDANQENMLTLTLSEYLMQLLKQKKLKRARVIHDSGLEKAYVYQIFKGEKKPSRDKLIALAFGLHLNVEETQRMLKLGGCSELYARTKRDALILFCIFRKKSIYDTDAALYKWGLTTLLPRDG